MTHDSRRICRSVTTVALAALVASGCATIAHGSRQTVAVGSAPFGAKIFVNDTARGVTPLAFSLRRGEAHKIRLELNGYQPFNATLEYRGSGWTWTNAAFGGMGLITFLIDVNTGAMFKFRTDEVVAPLKPRP